MTKQLFTASDYAKLHSIVFQPDYPGYKPDVVESPNGDGKKDDLKRYAHVAHKYLQKYLNPSPSLVGPCMREQRKWQVDLLSSYLDKAYELSLEVAISIGIPRPFWPVRKYGALRVLEYDGNAVTNAHTDFDLFTLMCYRNDESCFRYLTEPVSDKRKQWVKTSEHKRTHRKAKELNTQIHFGEILEEIDSVNFWADDHEVVASNGPWQYSIVYFAIPDHDAVLPSGLTVGKWIDERIKRSRYKR